MTTAPAPRPTPPPLRPAASVVLWRERGGEREIYWVRRSREVSLGGGFHAFPGGRVDEADAALAALWQTDGHRVAALRELFEETGVLLAESAAPAEARDEGRRQLLAGTLSFADACAQLSARPQPERLIDAGRWITPSFIKARFDARFFTCRVEEIASPAVWPGELVDGDWIRPAEALRRWELGTALLHPPARHILESLREGDPASVQERLINPPHVVDHVPTRIPFQAGIMLFPVRTPTLPPATHTNCYLVGTRELVVIDPASPYPEEQARLLALCRELLSEGYTLRAIVLTHEHHDHVSGATALAESLQLPVWAHAETAARLEGKVRVDKHLVDGERINLDGPLPIVLRAVHTPGHAVGHLCFVEQRSHALIVGDMVAGIGSVVVDPPDGDMRDYIGSLEALRALPAGTLYPAHGPAIPDGHAKLDEYLAHRREREAQVAAALQRVGRATPVELVPHVYSDVAPALHPLAARSLLAVLQKLVQEGRATRDGDHFAAA